MTTQKNFIKDIEKKYISDDNKKKLETKKKQFITASKKYLDQGEKLLTEIQNHETYLKSKNKFLEDFERDFYISFIKRCVYRLYLDSMTSDFESIT